MNDKETKWREECSAVGLIWVGRVGGNYSKCSCNVCGHVDDYRQDNIRLGKVKCSHCYMAKMREECSAVGLTLIEKVDGRDSKCSCNVCGHVDNYAQGHIRAGKVRCGGCQTTKYKSAAKDGWTFIEHYRENKLTYVNLKHSCSDAIVKVTSSHYLNGVYDCPQCQITKYKQAAKQGWVFIGHCCENKRTYISIQHSCSDDLVKVDVGAYLRGSYDCPHCMHTHFSDPSYFYVIQINDIIKLGISNRPNQRYTQYGLPDDLTITEHLRIHLETKRDALVVESYAKQLAKDYKIPSEAAKQVFTKSGFNECYDIECLPMLMSI